MRDRRPLILDLFSGAGGCSKGYHEAGFEVVGVDIMPQKNYPFQFVRADALKPPFDLSRFDAIHASPPCQQFSAMRKGRWQDREHPDLIEPVRRMLKASGRPYVIENVPGAPLINPFMLCGTMFGLQTAERSQLRRHREFECPWFFDLITPCDHNDYAAIGVYGGGQHPQRRYNQEARKVRVPEGAEYRRPAIIGVWGNAGGVSHRDGINHYGVEARREAMGIDWMSGSELSQAIPPAYTEFIGKALLEHLRGSQA